MGDGWGAALAAGLVAIIGALSTAVMSWYAFVHKSRTEERKNAIDEWRDVVAQKDVHIDRQQRQMDRMQVEMDEMQESHSTCQVRMERIWGWMVGYHNFATMVCQQLKDRGGNPIVVPPLPEREADQTPKTEFHRRSSEQNRRLIREVQPDEKPEDHPGTGG